MKGAQERQLKALLDREAIRDALARYARGIDRVAPDLIASAYHDESWDEHGKFSGPGHDFAKDSEPARRRATSENVISHHMLGQSSIDLDGDRADSETYFWCTGISRHTGVDRHYFLAGRYLDQFDRDQGTWRIRTRRTVIDVSLELADATPWESAQDYVSGQRWPLDVVFHRDRMDTRLTD